MKYTYPAVFEEDDKPGIAIWFPDLPRGASQGDNYDDAVEMAQDLLSEMLDDYEQMQVEFPTPGAVKEPLEPEQYIVNITVERAQ